VAGAGARAAIMFRQATPGDVRAAVYAAAVARQQRISQEAYRDFKGLVVADQFLAQGDVRRAGMAYLALALRRPRNSVTEAAGQKLARLQAEADKTMEELDRKLADIAGASVATSDDSDSAIVDLFRQYNGLVEKYGGLPRVGTQITNHVKKLRRQPQYTTVLTESRKRP
jgi:hypothetical protein